jgi:hypothetical protein
MTAPPVHRFLGADLRAGVPSRSWSKQPCLHGGVLDPSSCR